MNMSMDIISGHNTNNNILEVPVAMLFVLCEDVLHFNLVKEVKCLYSFV